MQINRDFAPMQINRDFASLDVAMRWNRMLARSVLRERRN